MSATWWQDRIPRQDETEQQAIARLHQKPDYGGSLEDARCAVWDAMDFARHPAALTPSPDDKAGQSGSRG